MTRWLLLVASSRGRRLPVDFRANAASLGAEAMRVCTPDALRGALAAARRADRTTAIVVPIDARASVGSYESWWDVPVAEVSDQEPVRRARAECERARRGERQFL
jgi:3D-(3,5/4)-trihydroxycyclohexane-1,2-dione acylhydrolase (decyclizing)